MKKQKELGNWFILERELSAVIFHNIPATEPMIFRSHNGHLAISPLSLSPMVYIILLQSIYENTQPSPNVIDRQLT